MSSTSSVAPLRIYELLFISKSDSAEDRRLESPAAHNITIQVNNTDLNYQTYIHELKYHSISKALHLSRQLDPQRLLGHDHDHSALLVGFNRVLKWCPADCVQSTNVPRDLPEIKVLKVHITPGADIPSKWFETHKDLVHDLVSAYLGPSGRLLSLDVDNSVDDECLNVYEEVLQGALMCPSLCFLTLRGIRDSWLEHLLLLSSPSISITTLCLIGIQYLNPTFLNLFPNLERLELKGCLDHGTYLTSGRPPSRISVFRGDFQVFNPDRPDSVLTLAEVWTYLKGGVRGAIGVPFARLEELDVAPNGEAAREEIVALKEILRGAPVLRILAIDTRDWTNTTASTSMILKLFISTTVINNPIITTICNLTTLKLQIRFTCTLFKTHKVKYGRMLRGLSNHVNCIQHFSLEIQTECDTNLDRFDESVGAVWRRTSKSLANTAAFPDLKSVEIVWGVIVVVQMYLDVRRREEKSDEFTEFLEGWMGPLDSNNRPDLELEIARVEIVESL